MKLTLKEKILQLNNFQSLDNFKLQKYLGKGSYGKVVSAFSEQLKETVAIKIIRKNKKKRNLQIDMEAYLLNKCESENIIKLHKVNLYLVLSLIFSRFLKLMTFTLLLWNMSMESHSKNGLSNNSN